MSTRTSTLVGVFDERTQAERAIEELHNANVPDNQITYSGSARNVGSGFAASIKSFFTGEDANANATALFSDLTDMGLSQDEAQYYTNQYQEGHVIVAVNSADQWPNAQNILMNNGAFNYNAQQSAMGTQATNTTSDPTMHHSQTDNSAYDQSVQENSDYAQTNTYGQPGTVNPDYNTTGSGDYANANDERTLKLREERLNVSKQTAQTGEVGLHKEVIEEQKNINVPVQHEEVWIERRSYGEDRPTDAAVGQDETFRVPVQEEQVFATKQTVETGEVALGKSTVQGQQQVSDTVRREEARVDKTGDTNVNETTTDQSND